MALLPPSVVGPLSVCSSNVRVEGQLAGATVAILANGVHVGGGVATWSDERFALNPGVTLAAGAQVTATQSQGTQTSPPSPQPVLVQKQPPSVGHVGCKTHIYACGRCIWLDGMVPGARVEVRVGGVLHGSGSADDGNARIGLAPQTQLGNVLDAQQTACGVAGPITPLPPADQVPVVKGHRLPAPTVQGPLRACQQAVTVSNVFEGAQVILSQTAGPTEQGCFDQSALWFRTNPLVQGETVSARQSFPQCELDSLNSPGVVVGPPTPVPPPTVVPPLCAGTTTVPLTGLLPGSKVRIIQNGIDLGTGEAPDSSFPFEVPPLTAGAMVTARQELCGIWSAPSNQVKVNPRPASLPNPIVPGPLYQCAAVVRVINIHPGSQVYVYSTLLAAPIGSQFVDATHADIPVAPQLITGDHVYAEEIGCGLTVKSAVEVVHPVVKPTPSTIVAPVEDCMRSVTVATVIPGARVDVSVNGAWRGTATAGGHTVEVPILYGPLHVGDAIRARQRICEIISGYGEPVIVVSHAPYYYVTQHFDVARTGWNPYETILTAGNVSGLSPLFQHTVDGTVYAQPLYAHHVLLGTGEAHNIVYVATENDTVYAFDADTDQPALWQRSLVPAGETPVADADIAGCDNIKPTVGITSTPVIDCATYTMYVVAKTKRVQGPTTTFHQRLHAIDIATGVDRPGSPREIDLKVPGSGHPGDGHGNVVFDPQFQLNRPGLLLLGGVVYVAFGSHCDKHLGAYHGWVASFDAVTLAHLATFCATPDAPVESTDEAAGIWQAGMGLAADGDGFIYCTTGNGDFSANVGGRNFGDTVLKLRAQLSVADSFTPADQPTLLRPGDVDLGSGGVLVIPDRPAGTEHSKLLVTCGKDGDIFLIDRTNMGGYNGPGGPDHVVQTLPIKPGVPKDQQPGVWGGPAYYHGPGEEFVYYCGNSGDHLKAYSLQAAALALSQIGGNPNQSSNAFPGEGGATPTVSSNQETPGTGVLWAITRSNPLRLQAYSATDLTVRLVDQPAGPWGSGGPFIEPTVIQGKVYVPSDGKLTVFGL